MATVKEIQTAISKMEKSTSLRQIAIGSGINYITLRNIKFGNSKRVTDGVSKRFAKFAESFGGPSAKAEESKPQTKVRAKARKTGRPKKSATAPKQAAAAKPTGGGMGTLLDPSALNAEIAVVEARLSYLRTLQNAHDAYFKFIGQR